MKNFDPKNRDFLDNAIQGNNGGNQMQQREKAIHPAAHLAVRNAPKGYNKENVSLPPLQSGRS